MRNQDNFQRARYVRQEFEEENPYPKLCGACYFLEDWDYIAPGDKPRLCIDCAGAIHQWHKKLDRYLEDYKNTRVGNKNRVEDGLPKIGRRPQLKS